MTHARAAAARRCNGTSVTLLRSCAGHASLTTLRLWELRLIVCNPMTSQERFRLAQQAHKRSKDLRLSARERRIAFRHACNLVRLNMVVAERECRDSVPATKPCRGSISLVGRACA